MSTADRAVGIGDVDAVGRGVLDRRGLRRDERATRRAEKDEGAEGSRRNKARFHGSSWGATGYPHPFYGYARRESGRRGANLSAYPLWYP